MSAATPVAASDPLPAGPAPDGVDTPYWEGLRAGRLRLPRCTDCRAWRPIGRILCPSCHGDAVAWEDVAPAGTVHTWIRTHRDFMSELDVPAPYVTVLVALADAPLRLLGLWVGHEAPAIGDAVAGRFVTPVGSAWPVLRWEAA